MISLPLPAVPALPQMDAWGQANNTAGKVRR